MSLNKKITSCFTKENYKKGTDGAGLRGASIEKFEHCQDPLSHICTFFYLSSSFSQAPSLWEAELTTLGIIRPLVF